MGSGRRFALPPVCYLLGFLHSSLEVLQSCTWASTQSPAVVLVRSEPTALTQASQIVCTILMFAAGGAYVAGVLWWDMRYIACTSRNALNGLCQAQRSNTVCSICPHTEAPGILQCDLPIPSAADSLELGREQIPCAHLHGRTLGAVTAISPLRCLISTPVSVTVDLSMFRAACSLGTAGSSSARTARCSARQS